MSNDQANNNVIDHAERPLKKMEKLFLSKEYADVTFIVQEESLPAHRYILAIDSNYFRALLFGNYAESNKKEIELNVNLEAFKVMLKYLYTGVITISDYEEALRIELVNLASEYGFPNLASELMEYMSQSLTLDNCLPLMNLANLYSEESVYAKTITFVDKNAFDILEHKSFLTLSKELIINIIKRDSFAADEVKIFNAVMEWSKKNTKEILKSVLAHVRFVLMQISEIEKLVEPMDILDSYEVVAIKQQIISLNSMPYRDGKIHRGNMDCQVISKSGTGEKWAWKKSSGNLQSAALFELECETVVNHITMTLSDKETSYYVEVSCDRRKWKRVIDFIEYNCYGPQDLYFALETVKYIYVAPGNVNDPNFEISHIVIGYKFYDTPIIIDGFVALKKPLGRNEENIQYFIFPSNFHMFRFQQPIYINCVNIQFSDCEQPLEFVEISLDGAHFKKISVKRSHSKSTFFFEAHAVHFVYLEFRKEVRMAKVFFFYQPGDINLYTFKET